MSEFKREDRYVIIKRTDLEYLTGAEYSLLSAMLKHISKTREDRGKQPLTGLVIEADWPEYEPAWKMIEDRVNSEPDSGTE